MIDEYQDTNTIQERIVLKLASRHRNICVVGDDDQALYRFRGASIRNVLEFPARFPAGSCKQIYLTKNYRSHPNIVEFYNRWMELADWQGADRSYRFGKVIEAAKQYLKTHSEEDRHAAHATAHAAYAAAYAAAKKTVTKKKIILYGLSLVEKQKGKER